MATSPWPLQKTTTISGGRSPLYVRVVIRLGLRSCPPHRIKIIHQAIPSKVGRELRCSSDWLAPTRSTSRTVAQHCQPAAHATTRSRCCDPIRASPKRLTRTPYRACMSGSTSATPPSKEQLTVGRSASVLPRSCQRRSKDHGPGRQSEAERVGGRKLRDSLDGNHTTRKFLNCHGSSRSRSSGNSWPRSCSGVQVPYLPTTGPR